MKDVEKIVAELTLEEKAGLCSGRNFWTTKAVKRLKIPSIMMTDGPHGMRKQRPDTEEAGLSVAVPATCFPSGAGLACSWNRSLMEEIGRALGQEAQSEGVAILLGPAVNIKRHPLCGRNFEYLSEDPFHAGHMAKHHIQGMNSEGVGASIKHFAANNQERLRMTIDTIVDERTLREIYFPAFEIAVKESQPWTVMCAYNRLNGTYCAENHWLLTDVLKNEWGHEGIVITDWGACNDRVEGLRAGQELEMPGNGGINDTDIVEAVRSGRLDEAVLDRAVKRILQVVIKAEASRRPAAGYDVAEHHALARRVAGESMVLLKNEGPLLPFKRQSRIAFIGAFAEHPRYQGAGSSHITPTHMDSVLTEARRLAGEDVIEYAEGYSMTAEQADPELLKEAASLAGKSDSAVVFTGLPNSYESEGFDREHIGIPASHVALIEAVAEVQENLVVVLSNGSPVEMPWVNKPKAILESYLGGQAWGGAVADILFGRVNPSGKLAETFPVRLQDCPAYINFPGDAERVQYAESVFVGYRYYDTKQMDVLFPFGFGLSYTNFEYRDLRIDPDGMSLSFEVENIGALPGQEVVQVYIHDLASTVLRPEQELKAFEKVHLESGEFTRIDLKLNHRSYAFWDDGSGQWVVEAGQFEIRVGASSRDIRLCKQVKLAAAPFRKQRYDQNTPIGVVLHHPEVGPIFTPAFERLAHMFGVQDEGTPEARMVHAMLREMPLRNLVTFGRGDILDRTGLKVLLDVLNNTRPAAELEKIMA